MKEKLASILGRLEGKNQYYLLVALLLVVFLLDYFLLMKPQLMSLTKINPEITAVSDKIQKAKDDVQRLSTYEQNLKDLSAKFESANLRVKSRDEVPVILEYIANIAGESGVKIDQITPDTFDQDLLTENSQRKYYDLPIYIEARSGYHNLGRFLDSLSKGNISLRIGAFTVASTNDNRYHLVKVTFRATVYEESVR